MATKKITPEVKEHKLTIAWNVGKVRKRYINDYDAFKILCRGSYKKYFKGKSLDYIRAEYEKLMK